MESIERQIQKALSNDTRLDRCADELVKAWLRGSLSVQEQQSVCRFLISCGFFSTLFSVVSKNLEYQITLPWMELIQAFYEYEKETRKKLVDRDLIQEFFTGAIEQDKIEDLVRLALFDKIDSRFSKIRSESFRLTHTQARGQKEKLLDHLEVLKNERLIQEEEKLLKKIKQEYPKDPKVLSVEKEFLKRKAKIVFQRLKEEPKYNLLEYNDPEIQALKSKFLKEFLNLAKTEPALAYDLSISLYMMNMPKEALEALDFAPNSMNKEWMKLYYLLENEKYASVLEQIDFISRNYPKTADNHYAYSFYRAKALWGLNKKENAIQLLKEIIDKQPNYKSAYSLLMQWEREY